MHPIFSPNAQLLCFLEEEIVNHRGNYHELFQDYATDDLFGNRIPCTLLQKALNEGKSDKVILKLVEIGGSELVKKRSINGETALHFVCMAQFSQSLHVNYLYTNYNHKDVDWFRNIVSCWYKRHPWMYLM